MTYLYINPLSLSWYLIITFYLFACIALLTFGKCLSEKNVNRLTTSLGIYLLFDRIFSVYYYHTIDAFSLDYALPLSFCSIMAFFASFALIFRSQFFFEFVLFLGMTGPVQAFITPAIVHAGEEYLLIDYFIYHGITIVTPIYMAYCLGFKPRKNAIYRVIVLMQILAAVVYALNLQLDANYMYLNASPDVDHPLNKHVWPIYLIYWHGLFYIAAFIIEGFFRLIDYIGKKTTDNII